MHEIWQKLKQWLACGLAFATVGCASVTKPKATFSSQMPAPAEVIPWVPPEPPSPFPDVKMQGPSATVTGPKEITFVALPEQPAKETKASAPTVETVLSLPKMPEDSESVSEDVQKTPVAQKNEKPDAPSKSVTALKVPEVSHPPGGILVIPTAQHTPETPSASLESRKPAPVKSVPVVEPKPAPDESVRAIQDRRASTETSLPAPLSIPIVLPVPNSETPKANDVSHNTLPAIAPIPVIPPVSNTPSAQTPTSEPPASVANPAAPSIPKFLTPPTSTVTSLIPPALVSTVDTTPIITAPPVAVPPTVGPVSTGNRTVSFETLSRMIGGDTVTPVGMSSGGCQSCGSPGGGNCSKCDPIPADSGLATRIVGNMYQALCCPDPCYQPKWIPLADTAFYTPSARPVSQTKLQWQYTSGAAYLDRGEYLWARSDGNGKGPKPLNAVGIPSVGINQLMQYTETAAGPGFSAFFVTPYRSWDGTYSNPHSAAGFGDMTIGTKGVLSDSELFLLTMQFTTTLPVGNAAKGLGTGHVSLEPSLLFGLRVSPKSYLQGQIAEWIPIAGDQTYAGAMLHYHLSYNHVLWQPISQVQLIGTLEMNGYSWQDGGFTDPATGFRAASGSNILQIGPGFRTFYCDKYDFGVGSAFGVTGKNSIGQQVNFEMRIRY